MSEIVEAIGELDEVVVEGAETVHVVTVGTPGPPGVSAIPQGTLTVGMGDSNMIVGATASAWSPGFFYLGAQLSQGRMRPLANKGVIGDTLPDMLARFDADVVALEPDRCLLMGGSNDAFLGISTGRSAMALLGMVERCKHHGIELIIFNSPPREGFVDEIAALNDVAENLASKHNCPFIDAHAAVADPDTGEWLPEMETGDGAHLASLGHKAIALLIKNKLAALRPVAPPRFSSLIAADTTTNLIANGIFTDVNANGLADGWDYVGDTGTQTPTNLGGLGDTVGRRQKLTTTVAGGVVGMFFQRAVTTGFTPGDTVRFAGQYADVVEAGGHSFSILCYCFNVSAVSTGVFIPVNTHAVDVTDGYFEMDFEVPAATVSMFPSLNPAITGTGEVEVSEFVLANLTTLDLA